MRFAQDAMLVVLALVVAGLVWLALRSDTATDASIQGGAAQPATTEAVTSTTTGGATGTSPEPEPEPEPEPDTAEVTEPDGDEAGETEVVVEETSAPAPAAGDPLEEAREVLTGDSPTTVAVLGDGTGESTRDWVHLWAAGLAEDRPVSVSHWDADPGTRHYPIVELSAEGTGEQVMVWNGSEGGGTAGSGLEGLDAFLPQSPDLVLLNYGHNQTEEDLAPELDALTDELSERYDDVPVVLLLQNPQAGDANADVREAATDWAETAEVGVIDIAAAFTASEEQLLVEGGILPDADGQQLWAETVATALN